MSGLADFITARLAEDEAAAMALGPVEGRWVIVTPEHGDEALLASETRGHAYLSLPLPMLDFLRHIIRHDPARELREVTAKRAILAEHAITDWTAYGDHMCTRCHRERDDAREDEDQCTWLEWPCPTIRAIATAWSDHPGYRAEWAPATTEGPS